MFFRSHPHPARGRIMLAAAWLYVMAPASLVADNIARLDGPVLDVTQLITQVLRHNPALRQQQAAVDAAAARITQAGALDDLRLSYTLAPETANLPGKDFGQKIMLSQKLPWPGKRELAARNWQLQTAAKRRQLDSTRVRLASEAADAYADWYLAHAAQTINDKSKALWREFQHLAELNYSTGRVGKQDVLKAELAYQRLRHRDISLQRQRREARTRINTLLERATEAALPPPPAQLTLPSVPVDVRLLRQQALARRPELQALGKRIEAAGSRLQRARLDDYPDLSLNAGWNSLWDQDEKRWTIGLTINLPLDGGRRGAARDQARAERLRLQSQRDVLAADIAAEVQQAHDSLLEARHELALYHEQLLPTARAGLEASRTDYQSGSGDFLSLINTENNLFKLELGALQARVSAFRQQTALNRSLGLIPQLSGQITPTPSQPEGDQP